MGLDSIQQYYKQRLIKEASVEDRAEREARDEGFDDFSDAEASGVRRAKKIMEAIKRKESYTEALDDKFEGSSDIEKGWYSPDDWAAIATAKAKKDYKMTSFKEGSEGAAVRDAIAAGIERKHGPGGYGTANWRQADPSLLGSKAKKDKKAVQH